MIANSSFLVYRLYTIGRGRSLPILPHETKWFAVMSKLVRFHSKTDVCFITSVTNRRERILIENVDLLKNALFRHSQNMGFEITAYVIMPDHFHSVIDCRKNDLSDILQKIKLSFSKQYRYRIEKESGIEP